MSALLQQQVQLHGGVVEEFLERLPDSDRVCNSVAAADVDGDCLLRQHCPLEVVVVVVAGVVFVSNRDEDEVDGDAAATVVVDVLSLVGATEPAETTFDEGAVVVGFEELPSTTIWSRPAAVTAGAVRVAAAASSLPASDCVELPAAAAVVKDATVVLLGCTALMLPVVADSVESWSCRLGVTSGGGGVPAGDILDPAVC